ncbi:MAG: tetratricopeptide repeat protein, partial [Planctomycetota bacterium]|nr:tetratricopeptide repeat protein [Planctomycetota bacterium]
HLSLQNAGSNRKLPAEIRFKFGLEEARESLQRAVAIDPLSLHSVLNLGRTLYELGELAAGEQVLRANCRVHPDSPAAHHYWGVALDLLGQHHAAIDQFDVALGLDPAYVHCLCSKGLCFQRRGDLQDAIAFLERAVSLRPDLTETHSCYLSLASNDASRSPEWLFRQHCQWGEIHGRVTNRFEHRDHDRNPQRRLRIGYVSPDFRQHAVMRYLEPVLKHHNPDCFELYAYSQVLVEDEVTLRAKAYVPQWRSTCGLSDEQVADLIVADGIDILVDLAGHTANNRLRAFAYKPAPVQVTWLGYPHTTGLSTVDYFLTNSVQDPPHESYHLEIPIHLSHDTCFDPLDGGGEVIPPPALANGFITFGSLHRHEKISSDSLDLWARVLTTNRTARLVVFNTSLTNDAKEFLHKELIQRGIAQQRFTLRSQAPDAGYLKVYDGIDIAFDVFPWSGGTTTREALWMGVPVIALYGDRRSARSTAAALTQVGIPEWIAYSTEEYVDLATKLANDIGELARIRSILRDNMRKTICNAAEFTRTLESTYRKIWRTSCQRSAEVQLESESNSRRTADYSPNQFSRTVV